jgi:hypothetical protein
MEIPMVPLEEIFCFIDDFCKSFEQYSNGYFLDNPARKRKRSCHMTLCEIMTILIIFQFSHYRTFKDFYFSCLIPYYKTAFPKLVSYNRFLELIPYVIMPMIILLINIPGQKTGKYFIDSTKLFGNCSPPLVSDAVLPATKLIQFLATLPCFKAIGCGL